MESPLALLGKFGAVYFRWDFSRGVLLDVSESVKDVVGWSRDELLADPLLAPRMTHPDFVPRLQEMVSRWGKSKPDQFRFEGQFISRDGREVWLEISGVPEYAMSGELTGAQAFAMDITEIVLSRRVAQEASQRYQTLFEDAPMAMLLYDPDTFLILEANQQACRLYGLPREELEGTFLEDRVAPEEWPRMEERLRRAVGDPRVEIVSRMLQRRADGSKFPAQVASVTITRDSRPRRLAVVRDLTDVEMAEASLRSLRKAAESAQRALLIIDRSRRIVFANAEASAITGYSIEELHGQDPRLVAARGFEDAWWRGLEEAAAGKAWKGKMGLEGPGISGRVVNVEIIPVTTIAGAVTHCVMVLSESAGGNPLGAVAGPEAPPKDCFVAYLADPVADALAAVQDLTEQVLASPELSENLKPDVRGAFEQSTAALHLVREFEWVLGRHSEEGSPARGDLTQVIDEVLRAVEARMGERVLEARCDLRLDMVPVQAPVILRETLLRILNHAVASDPGDPVVLDLTLVETVRNGCGHCRLRIASRGGPTEGEQRARMFEMPRLAAAADKPPREPDLALSRILIELLGGTLHAENRVPSAPGEGTAYIVTLPTLRK